MDSNKSITSTIAKLEAQIKAKEEENSLASSSPLGYNPYKFVSRYDARELRLEKTLSEISQALTLTRLPQAEPGIFSGDPLTFHRWEADIKLLLDSCNISSREKLQILMKYLAGTARSDVESLSMVPLENGYKNARRILSKRFGNPFYVADAFRTKLEEFPKIGPNETNSLQSYSDFLNQIKTITNSLKELKILDDVHEIKKVSSKLPDWLFRRWARRVSKNAEEYGYPDFAHFCEFVEREKKIACDPVFRLAAEETSRKIQRVTHLSKQEETFPRNKCAFCDKTNHATRNCWYLEKLPEADINEFISNKHQCFKCLHGGHSSRNCSYPGKCRFCSQEHASVMHKCRQNIVDPEKAEQTNGRLVHEIKRGLRGLSAMIVPVDVWERSSGIRYTTYALLDTQSDTSFITDRVANALRAQGSDTTLSVSTMTTSKQEIRCKRYHNLEISAHVKRTPSPCRQFIAEKRFRPTWHIFLRERMHPNFHI